MKLGAGPSLYVAVFGQGDRSICRTNPGVLLGTLIAAVANDVHAGGVLPRLKARLCALEQQTA
jgi:hypothetical protein